MSREKRAIRVELLGHHFTLRSDDDEAYVRELVGFVNKKLEDMRNATGRVEAEQVALLAALELADALFRERRQSDALRRTVRERSKNLLGAIDRIARSLDGAGEPAVATVQAAATPQAPIFSNDRSKEPDLPLPGS